MPGRRTRLGLRLRFLWSRARRARRCRGRGRCDGEVELIVDDGQGGNRSAVAPDSVVDAPVAGIRFPRPDCIASDDVALDPLDAFLGDRLGELVEIAERGRRPLRGFALALRGREVREGAPGKVRVARAIEVEIALQRSVFVNLRVCGCGRNHTRRSVSYTHLRAHETGRNLV